MSDTKFGKLPDPIPVTFTKVRSDDGDSYLKMTNTSPVLIAPGKTIRLRIPTKGKPMVVVPENNVFHTTVFNTILVGKEWIAELTVKDNPIPIRNPFAFMVYSPDDDTFAIANSPPRMILGGDLGPDDN